MRRPLDQRMLNDVFERAFLLGGCGFWLLVLTVLWAWYLLKATAWAVVLMCLVLAQGVSLAAELAWRPVTALRG